MNEIEAVRIAQQAADKIGYPWNASNVAVSRHRALFLFPIWRVTSALTEGNYIVQATIPDRVAHVTRIEMLSTRGAPPHIIRRRIARICVQAVVVWAAVFVCIRKFLPSTLLRDITVATAFTLLGTFATESCLSRRTLRRKSRDSHNA